MGLSNYNFRVDLLVSALLLLQACGSKMTPSISLASKGNAATVAEMSLTAGSDLGTFNILVGSANQGQSMALPYQGSSEGEGLNTYWFGTDLNYEHFKVVSLGSGYYQISETLGGRCITTTGAAVSIQTCNLSTQQAFQFIASTNGNYALMSGLGSCLSALGSFKDVTAQSCDSSANQTWQFVGPTPLVLDSTNSTPSPTSTPVSTPVATVTPVPTQAAPTPSNTGATPLGQFGLYVQSATSGNAMNLGYGTSDDGEGVTTYWNPVLMNVISFGNGEYSITESLGGRCLTLANQRVIENTCDGSSAQRYHLLRQNDGSVEISFLSGGCMGAAAFSDVTLVACDASAGVKWVFTGNTPLILYGESGSIPTTTPSNTPSSTPTATPSATPAPVGAGPSAGIYYLQNIRYSQNIAVSGGTGSNGGSLVLYDRNTANGQKFSAVNMGNNLYELIEQSASYCVVANGAAISLAACNGSTNQLFAIEKNTGDGAYFIQTSTGSCVTARGQSDLVIAASCTSTNDQEWYFQSSGTANPTPTPTATPISSATPTSSATPGPIGALPNNMRILTLGDSMTGGYGAPEQGGYRAPLYNFLVQEGYQPQMVGSGVCGGVATSTTYPLPSNQNNCDGYGGIQIDALDNSVVSNNIVATQNPDVVLLWVGFNSLYYTSNTISQDLAQLDQLLSDVLAQKPNVRVIVAQLIASTQCCGTQNIVQYNQGIPGMVAAKVALGYHVTVLNLYGTQDNPLVPPSELYDYVHPNAQGYVAVANAWLQAIDAVAH